MSRIQRRELLLGAAAAVVALPALAQPARARYRIGQIGYYAPQAALDEFRNALLTLGYNEGDNLVIETRYARGSAERLQSIVAEIVALKVDVIVAGSTQTVLAAMRATRFIPIVFASVFDPVGSGIVASLARPGGNVTGAAIGMGGGTGIGQKWVELLKEIAPRISRVAALVNLANPASAASLQEVTFAARSLALRVDVFDSGSDKKLDQALADIATSGAEALIVTNDPLFTPHAARLAAYAARRRLPAMYFFATFADAGGLMAYGASQEDSYRRAAYYVDKILRGAKPGELPVEQPTVLSLVINMKTAKALGLTVPESILVRADRLIE